jgi:hypothetical protein
MVPTDLVTTKATAPGYALLVRPFCKMVLTSSHGDDDADDVAANATIANMDTTQMPTNAHIRLFHWHQ